MKFNTKKGGPAAAGGSERKSMKMEADELMEIGRASCRERVSA